MGQKEPLEDTGVTHVMCAECFKKQTGHTPEEAAAEESGFKAAEDAYEREEP